MFSSEMGRHALNSDVPLYSFGFLLVLAIRDRAEWILLSEARLIDQIPLRHQPGILLFELAMLTAFPTTTTSVPSSLGSSAELIADFGRGERDEM